MIPGPQKAQTPTSEDLDGAIDRVALRLTHVDDDAMFAQRIVAALPERRGGLTWIFAGWVPGLAAIAVIVAAAAMWSNRDQSPTQLTNESRPELSAFAASIEPLQPLERMERVGTRPLERVEPVEPLEPDHERSLVSLSVNALVAEVVPEAGLLALEPLAIAELPLTAESFPER